MVTSVSPWSKVVGLLLTGEGAAAAGGEDRTPSGAAAVANCDTGATDSKGMAALLHAAAGGVVECYEVGRRRVLISKPVLKASTASALEARLS
jgi:hypothetical protein